MTLIEQNPVSHLLDGMVKCRNCSTPMETAGESFNEASRYVCATKNEGCNTPDIEAGPFNRLVVRRAIHAFLHPENTNRVLDIVLNEAMSKADEDLRTMLDLTNPGPNEKPTPFGGDPKTASMVLGDGPITEGEVFPGIQYFANRGKASRKVKQYALDPDTYLRPSNIRTTRAIMEIIISEILTDPDSATIRYKLLVHPEGWPLDVDSEQVPTR